MIALKLAFTWSAAASAAISGWFWYKSSTVKVLVGENPSETEHNGLKDFTITFDDKTDFLRTGRKQAQWNKYAAIATCVAAGFQAVALSIPVSN